MVKALAEFRAKLRRKKKGFTLIELLVVLAILAVLAAVLVPLVGGFLRTAKQSAANADAHTVFTAAASVIALNANTKSYTSYKAASYTAGIGYVSTGTGTMLQPVDLTGYLGSHYSAGFTIEEINIGANGIVIGAVVEEINTGYTGTYGTV